MLKIHHSLQLPQLVSRHPQMALSTVASDGDELLEAIQADDQNDRWTLEATPDTEQLEESWSHIVEDVRQDPEWFTFAED